MVRSASTPGTSRSFVAERTATLASSSCTPVRSAIRLASVSRRRATAAPDIAAPEEADADRRPAGVAEGVAGKSTAGFWVGAPGRVVYCVRRGVLLLHDCAGYLQVGEVGHQGGRRGGRRRVAGGVAGGGWPAQGGRRGVAGAGWPAEGGRRRVAGGGWPAEGGRRRVAGAGWPAVRWAQIACGPETPASGALIAGKRIKSHTDAVGTSKNAPGRPTRRGVWYHFSTIFMPAWRFICPAPRGPRASLGGPPPASGRRTRTRREDGAPCCS